MKFKQKLKEFWQEIWQDFQKFDRSFAPSSFLNSLILAVIVFVILLSVDDYLKEKSEREARSESYQNTPVATEAPEPTLAPMPELTPEPENLQVIGRQALQEFYVEHTWDGTFKELDGHMVSIDYDGRLMLDGYDGLRYGADPPWSVGGWAIDDISSREDLYVISDLHGTITHYHLGEIVEKFETTDDYTYKYSYWQAAVGLDDYIIGRGHDGTYELLNYRTGERTVLDEESAAEYLPPMESYDGVDPIPLDEATAEYVELARQALNSGWGGEFAEIADGLWAVIYYNGEVSFNNGAYKGHVALPGFTFRIWANNVAYSESVTSSDNMPYCAAWAKDGLLTVYTSDGDQAEFELPAAGVHKILGSKFQRAYEYHKVDGGFSRQNDRTFNLAIETILEDGARRLDVVSGDLDYVVDGKNYFEIDTLGENTEGASIYRDVLIYMKDGTVYATDYWDEYGMLRMMMERPIIRAKEDR